MENKKNIKDKAKDFINNVDDTTKDYEKKDIESGKVMAILSYLGILCLIPYFTEKNNKYVVYHAKQGMNLLMLWICYSIVYRVAGWISSFLLLPLGLLELVFLALMILGIYNAVNGKAKELPIVNKVKFFK